MMKRNGFVLKDDGRTNIPMKQVRFIERVVAVSVATGKLAP
jgi:hypothetical protein